MDRFLEPELLDAARLPAEPGVYWAKKSPMADWEPVQVKVRPGGTALIGRDRMYATWRPLYEFYEWGPLVAESPDDRPFDLTELVGWGVRKEQRRVLKARRTEAPSVESSYGRRD